MDVLRAECPSEAFERAYAHLRKLVEQLERAQNPDAAIELATTALLENNGVLLLGTPKASKVKKILKDEGVEPLRDVDFDRTIYNAMQFAHECFGHGGRPQRNDVEARAGDCCSASGGRGRTGLA